MTHQIQRIVECQCRIVGDIDGRVIEQIDSSLELVCTLNTHGWVFWHRRRGCRHVDAAESANEEAVVRVAELDAVHRYGYRRGNGGRTSDACCVSKDRRVIGTVGLSAMGRSVRVARPVAQFILRPSKFTGQPRRTGDGCKVRRNVKHWSLTTLQDKLVKIGVKVTRHSKYVIFQLAAVAVTRKLFATILDRIEGLGLPPPDINGRMLA